MSVIWLLNGLATQKEPLLLGNVTLSEERIAQKTRGGGRGVFCW